MLAAPRIGMRDVMKSRNAKKTGTGLVLSIAYGIIERHKGALRVESSPGHGTTIAVILSTDIKAIDD